MKKFLLLSLLVISLNVSAQNKCPEPNCRLQAVQLITDKNRPLQAYKGPYGIMNPHGITFTDMQFVILDEDLDVLLEDEYVEIKEDQIKEKDVMVLRNPRGLPIFSSKIFKDFETFKLKEGHPILVELYLKKVQPVKINDELSLLYPIGDTYRVSMKKYYYFYRKIDPKFNVK
jgi:hypothetical protein